MEQWGNDRVNACYEAHMPSTYAMLKPNYSASAREKFIRDKYVKRLFYDPSPHGTPPCSDDSPSSECVEDVPPPPSRPPIPVYAYTPPASHTKRAPVAEKESTDVISFRKAMDITDQIMSAVGSDQVCFEYISSIMSEIGVDFLSYRQKFRNLSSEQLNAMQGQLKCMVQEEERRRAAGGEEELVLG